MLVGETQLTSAGWLVSGFAHESLWPDEYDRRANIVSIKRVPHIYNSLFTSGIYICQLLIMTRERYTVFSIISSFLLQKIMMVYIITK